MNIEDISLTQTIPSPGCRSGPRHFNLNHQPPDVGSKEHESSIAPPVIPWVRPLAIPLDGWPRVFPGL